MTKDMDVQSSRILLDKITIEDSQVVKFFENRAKNTQSQDPLVAVLFQDHNPELARKRDLYEMEHCLPLLNLDDSDMVIDIGCGNGRWAEKLQDKIAYYLGVDPIAGFIDQAKKKYVHNLTVEFDIASSQNAYQIASTKDKLFSKVIYSGVLHYLNDQECEDGFLNMLPILRSGCLIYIRSSLAIDQRLTLKSTWSDELKDHYSAIYRTKNEYMEFFEKIFFAQGFKLQLDRPLYPAIYNNRDETYQHIFILQRP